MHDGVGLAGGGPVPLQPLLDDLADGVTVFDRTGVVRYTNPAFCALFRCEPDDIVGQAPPLLIWPEGECDRYQAWHEHLIVQGKLHEDPLRVEGVAMRDSAGSLVRVNVTLTALRDRQAEPRLVYTVMRPEDPSPQERLAEVEQGLRRIAAELVRLGVPEDALTDLPSSTTEQLARLPQRQREIVELLLRGHRVPTIARLLHISPHTVRNHLKSVFRRFEVTSQAELLEHLRGD